MLGNDVIDLDDIDARPETFRPRFDDRVFSAEERRVIARDAAPLACRWAHWGAKEAAYKLARQVNPNFVFSPIQLTPHFEPAQMASAPSLASTPASRTASMNWVERRGTLNLPSQRVLEIRSYETRDSVHVIALPANADWDALVFSVEERTPAADPSRSVRALAIREIGLNLGIETNRLEIGRRAKIPTVELDGGSTSLSLSLSHHGRFIAFAMTPRLDEESDRDTSSEMILTDQVIDSVSPKTASE